MQLVSSSDKLKICGINAKVSFYICHLNIGIGEDMGGLSWDFCFSDLALDSGIH